MNRNPGLHRRRFIRTFAFGTAASALLGRIWTEIFAAEIAPLAIPSVGTLRLNLPEFPALLSESGSVRLGVNPLTGSPPSGPIPSGQFYPIIINRGPNDTFFALNSRCTHQGCMVDPLDPFSNRMTCPCHGSVFAIDGRRLAGLATTRLTAYAVRFDGRDRLEVDIPNLGFRVTSSKFQPAGGGNPRLRLDFRALRNVEYEVYFRDSLGQPPAPVPFSRTADGIADGLVFRPTSNVNASLFVERNSQAGFYLIAVRSAEM